MNDKKIKALVLFSGGLDSILAAKLLLAQGIDVELICFTTVFFDANAAKQSAKILGLSLREVDISEDFLTILKKPKHGYGAGLNPCIDCHTLMFKKAGEIMKTEGFDFVATGEVLGERPMSQHRRALGIVENDSGLDGYLLRPLSAKLLEPTMAEQQGLVDREKLLDISGRRRERQMQLAKEFGIIKYPSPGGGCCLTQSGFAGRLKDLMAQRPDLAVNDAALAGLGRHFYENNVWIILGRNDEENKLLRMRAQSGDTLIELENIPGSLALIRGGAGSDIIERSKELIIEFSPKTQKAKKESLEFKIYSPE